MTVGYIYHRAADAHELTLNVTRMLDRVDAIRRKNEAINMLKYPHGKAARNAWDDKLNQVQRVEDDFNDMAQQIEQKLRHLSQEVLSFVDDLENELRACLPLKLCLETAGKYKMAVGYSNNSSLHKSAAAIKRIEVIQEAAKLNLDGLWIGDESPVQPDPDDCDFCVGLSAPASCQFEGLQFPAEKFRWGDPIETWARTLPNQRAVNFEPAAMKNGQIVRTALVLTADLNGFDSYHGVNGPSPNGYYETMDKWVIENIPVWPLIFPLSGFLSNGWKGSPGGVILTVDYRSRKLSLVIQFDREPCSVEEDRAWVAECLNVWACMLDFAMPKLTNRATVTADYSFAWLPLRRPSRSCDFVLLGPLSQ